MVASEATPTFLHPIMSHILLAGKSMHLIESIGKFKHLQEGVAQSSPSKGCGPHATTPTGIYEEFLQSIKKLKPSSALIGSCDRSCDDEDGSHDEEEVAIVLPKKERGGACCHQHFDPLVNSYLRFMDDPLVTHVTPIIRGPPLDNKGLIEILEDRSMPLTTSMQTSMIPLIKRRYRTVSNHSPLFP